MGLAKCHSLKAEVGKEKIRGLSLMIWAIYMYSTVEFPLVSREGLLSKPVYSAKLRGKRDNDT